MSSESSQFVLSVLPMHTFRHLQPLDYKTLSGWIQRDAEVRTLGPLADHDLRMRSADFTAPSIFQLHHPQRVRRLDQGWAMACESCGRKYQRTRHFTTVDLILTRVPAKREQAVSQKFSVCARKSLGGFEICYFDGQSCGHKSC
jgi:hypothetical protein